MEPLSTGGSEANGTLRCFRVSASEGWVCQQREGPGDGAVVQHHPRLPCSGSAGMVLLGEGPQSEPGLVETCSRAALLLGFSCWHHAKRFILKDLMNIG